MVEMKDSGIEWVGQIPINWQVMSNKYVMSKIKDICPIYKGQDILSLTINGVIIRDLDAGGKMPTTFDGYQKLYPNNLLMCLFDYDVTPRCIGLIKNKGLTSPAYSQFIMKNNNSSRYYYYYYLMIDTTKELLHLAKNLRHSFTEEQLGAIKTPVPPIEEQEKIADFLDSKCSEIDAISAEIQEQIATLEEYKKSVITEAVTKGLDPNAEIKDSGIEWIGQIPKDWKIKKFKHQLYRNEVKNKGNLLVLSLYRDYGVIPKSSRDDNHNVTSEDTSKYKFVRIGDFVVNKMKAWQGSVAVSNNEGIVSPAYYVYSFKKSNYNKRYFHYLLRSCYKDEFRRLSGGIREGQWDLPAERLEDTLIIIPPLTIQNSIVEFLDSKSAEIDAVIEDKQKQLETLEEYKKTMIYEYVTGKKEVV